jgi:flagellar basal body rod protein FlgB
MLKALIGSNTLTGALREGLNTSAQRGAETAHRIANAFNGTQTTFDEALQQASAGEPIDVEAEMVALADEQLRFEATTRLLQKVYQQIRSSVRER